MSRLLDLINKIDKEEFISFYNNHSNSDTAEYYNISVYNLISLLNHYGIQKHTKQENYKLSCLNKYGTDNAFKNDLIKDKICKTKLNKYGNKNFNNPDKRKNTCLEKYGTPSASGNVDIQNKVRQTNLIKYGVDNQFKRVEHIKSCIIDKHGSLENFYKLQEKHRNRTFQELYGVDNPSQIVENRKLAICKGKKTLKERYGVESATLLPQVIFHNGNSATSIPNKSFLTLLNNSNINSNQEFTLKRYSYDFKVNNNLIEINPFATHNSTWSPFGEKSIKDKYYHFNKTKFAKENGYRCINVWDWDEVDKIISLLKERNTLYARKCFIKELDVKECKSFINEHHLQGYVKSEINIGLYFNDELVSVMTFGKPRYNKNYEYELIRYCSSYNVIGGAEKIFKYFIKTYNPESIISYCDNSKFNGDTYIKLGFNLKSYGEPSKHWYNPKTKKHITDNLLRQRGFDQLLGKEYGCFGKGTSNEQLMLEHGFVEIYDCGQSVYVYINEKI